MGGWLELTACWPDFGDLSLAALGWGGAAVSWALTLGAGGYFSPLTFRFLIRLFKTERKHAGPRTARRQELGFMSYLGAVSLAEQM